MKKRLLSISLFIILFSIFSCGGLKDPLKAPELKGSELDDFLELPIKYGPTFHNDSVKSIFYSGNLIEGMKILTPKKLGTVNKVKHYAIIIQQTDNPNNNTILFFENADAQPNKFTKLQQGDLTRHQNAMNPILLSLYPTEYFKQVADDIAEYDEGEPQRTAERKERLEKDMYAITHHLKDYKLVTYFYKEIAGTVLNVEQPRIFKYAVSSYGGFRPQQESNGYTYWIDNYAGSGIIIEMTDVQAQQLTAIKEEHDEALILLTRTDKKTTYKTAIGDLILPYKLVADYIIPFKDIYGISDSDIMKNLPKNFWFQNKNMDEIAKLYLDTGKTDPDGRIANAIKR